MRKGKKIVAAVVAAMLTFGLVGCGSSGSGGSGNTGSAGGSETGGSSDGETIKIGIMTDTSGDNAITCNLEAFQLAVDEINEAGGVLGKQIEPVIVDGQSDTQRYQNLAKELILEDDCAVVFQDGTSANREAIRSTFEENKKLLIYPTFYEGGVASRYCICTGTGPEQSILPMMQYIKDNNIGNKVYILAADYNYGQISAQWVQEYCEQLGMEVVGTEFSPLGTSQFSSSITKIQDSGADVVYTLLVGAAQSSFFDQWVNADIEGVTLASTCNIVYSYEQKKVAAPGLSGMISAGNFFEDMGYEDGASDAAVSFVEKFREKYPDEDYITNQAEGAYTAVYLWKAAVEKAGTTETEAVIDAFDTDEVSFDAPSGTVSVDGATHQATLTVTIMQVQDDHTLKTLQTCPDVEPTYLKDLGIDVRVDDPQTQYSPLENGTGN